MYQQNDSACQKINILDILKNEAPTKICAPMVRYSKLAFRTLVRKYECDIAYTPMIVANSFVRSQKCRDVDFVTSENDKPLIVQFAASNAADFASATELVYPYVEGVDLNCGCPQRWAMEEGYGAKLLQNPEEIVDFLKMTRNRISDSNFSISAKIRIHDNPSKTVYMCQALEKIGVSFIAVHGRTTAERHQPVHYDVIKLVKESLSIPVVANGDVTSLEQLNDMHARTGADGVMVAQGLLNNPALFKGYECTPISCVCDWLEICEKDGIHFTCFHNHLIYMLKKVISKFDRRIFNSLKTKEAVMLFLNERFEFNDKMFVDC